MIKHILTRRQLALGTGSVFAAGAAASAMGTAPAGAAKSSVPPVIYSDRARPRPHHGNLSIGCLIFPRLDQIDFTGPFEVFARIPDVTIEVVASDLRPVTDVKGLKLVPTMTIADAPLFDVLAVSGGLGQQAIMEDPAVMSLIERHAAAGKIVFSVCTGALLCGAAGILKGRKATTHWSAIDLLKYYGATAIDARVVVDGTLVTAAGVTAGLDGALVLAALLRGDEVAEEIQLNIQYAPNPVFHSGEPGTAKKAVIASFLAKYSPDGSARRHEAERFARKLGVRVS